MPSPSEKFRKELNGGLVGFVLLAVLAAAGEDLYGYEIARRLARCPEGPAVFREGSIYPVLRGMSANGWLTSRIVPSYSGPPRRYYRITEAGQAVLAGWRETWRATRAFVDHFADAGGAP